MCIVHQLLEVMSKSHLVVHPLRLGPGQELFTSLLKYVKEYNLKGAFIMTCCGSLTKATIRLAAHSPATPNNVSTIMHVYLVLSPQHAGLHILSTHLPAPQPHPMTSPGISSCLRQFPASYSIKYYTDLTFWSYTVNALQLNKLQYEQILGWEGKVILVICLQVQQ